MKYLGLKYDYNVLEVRIVLYNVPKPSNYGIRTYDPNSVRNISFMKALILNFNSIVNKEDTQFLNLRKKTVVLSVTSIFVLQSQNST